jgi:hypothetical protein
LLTGLHESLDDSAALVERDSSTFSYNADNQLVTAHYERDNDGDGVLDSIDDHTNTYFPCD